MKLESLDRKIIQTLVTDARASYREIARRIGVSTPTVSARVKELEALGVLGGYQAVVRTERLNVHTLFLRIKTEVGAVEQVAEELTRWPEVRQLHLATRHNLLLRAVFPEMETVQDFLRRLTSLKGIEDYEEFTLLETYKEEPPIPTSESLTLAVDCFYCGKRITGEPIKLRLDGRYHYLCCPSCADLYEKKYARRKSEA